MVDLLLLLSLYSYRSQHVLILYGSEVYVWLVLVWIVGLTGTSLLILGAISGLIFAPIIPLTFAYFNQRLNVVPILLALVLCGQALGIITFQKVAGKFIFEKKNKTEN